MPRIARSIVANVPYHVTHRGNRQQDVFFTASDKKRYLYWLAMYSQKYRFTILAYCLMTNHVHIVGIPETGTSIAQMMHVVHTRHTQTINKEHGWHGHLFQGRYFSTALDDPHLWACIRYVEQNPLRADMVLHPADYPWSSAAYHCGIKSLSIASTPPEYKSIFDNWYETLKEAPSPEIMNMIRHRTHKGIPCGDADFIKRMKSITGHDYKDLPRGRPRKNGT